MGIKGNQRYFKNWTPPGMEPPPEAPRILGLPGSVLGFQASSRNSLTWVTSFIAALVRLPVQSEFEHAKNPKSYRFEPPSP